MISALVSLHYHSLMKPYGIGTGIHFTLCRRGNLSEHHFQIPGRKREDNFLKIQSACKSLLMAWQTIVLFPPGQCSLLCGICALADLFSPSGLFTVLEARHREVMGYGSDVEGTKSDVNNTIPCNCRGGGWISVDDLYVINNSQQVGYTTQAAIFVDYAVCLNGGLIDCWSSYPLLASKAIFKANSAFILILNHDDEVR